MGAVEGQLAQQRVAANGSTAQAELKAGTKVAGSWCATHHAPFRPARRAMIAAIFAAASL